MSDENYWLYVYKLCCADHQVAKCPAKERHDWSNCPYAHRGERAARRCPQTFRYSADPCPEYSKKGTCGQGDSCPMAHSVFESWLHPNKFRTLMCCFGDGCRRRICFFAHNAAELRTAAPPTAQPAGPVLRRTQTVVSVNAPAVQQLVTSAIAGPSAAPFPDAAAAVPPAVLLPAHQQQAAGHTIMQPAVMNPGSWVPYLSLNTGGPVAAARGQGPMVAFQLPTMAATVPAAPAAPAPSNISISCSAVDVDTLTSGLQGLVLQQDPAVMILQQQPGGTAPSAQQVVVAGQAGVYMPTGLGNVGMPIGSLSGVYSLPPGTGRNDGVATAGSVGVMYRGPSAGPGMPGQGY